VRRRDFIKAIAGSVAAWPLTARAQRPPIPVVGFLGTASADGYRSMVAAFRQGLQESGYIEGRNVGIEYRWAEGRTEQLPALAADLVRSQVSIIATASTPAALAAKAATTNIPIVFEMAGDPVQVGLVASLDRPGANATGVANLNIQITPKRLQLLHEVVPTARVMALLVNPANLTVAETQSREARSAAQALGIDLHVLNATTESDLDAVFANLIQLRAGGLVIAADPSFRTRSQKLGELTVGHAVPAISGWHEFVAAGGLMSYGVDAGETYRLAGIYVGRILNGERPADLPVQQATKVELSINLKTAKALGLNVPNTLIGRANEVIE
jgi:putative tryptophan/tyrosine transport system substrate-binding protein